MSRTNKEVVFEALWTHMERLAKSGDKADGVESRRIADQLISHAELPLLYRIRAHMTLACGNDSYVWHAQEAVRLAEKSIALLGSGTEPGEELSEEQAQTEQEAEQDLLECARETLRDAEKDFAELQAIRKAYNESGSTGKWVVKYGGRQDVQKSAKSAPTQSQPAVASHTGPVSTTIEKDALPGEANANSFLTPDDARDGRISHPAASQAVYAGDDTDAAPTTQNGAAVNGVPHLETDTTHNHFVNDTLSAMSDSSVNGTSHRDSTNMNVVSRSDNNINGATTIHENNGNGVHNGIPNTVAHAYPNDAFYADTTNDNVNDASTIHQDKNNRVSNGISSIVPHAYANGAIYPDTTDLNGATPIHQGNGHGDHTGTYGISHPSANGASYTDTANIDDETAVYQGNGGAVGSTDLTASGAPTQHAHNPPRRSGRSRKPTKAYDPATGL
ncbi:hypothetical protein KCU92_g8139, partial [Aureobasidium melanogenum]|jgi:hypothetical protein